jgi:hypothetical protein
LPSVEVILAEQDKKIEKILEERGMLEEIQISPGVYQKRLRY